MKIRYSKLRRNALGASQRRDCAGATIYQTGAVQSARGVTGGGEFLAKDDKQRLLESEQRFRAAIEAVDGILWTNNAAGEMEGEQPGWTALTGQSPEEYRGFGWSKAVHPDDARPTIDAWKTAVAERRAFVFEHRVRRRDGEWRLFSIRAVPTFDPSGALREWVGVHTDITERRANELALQDLMATLEQRVEAALTARDRIWDNARDLLAVADAEGVFCAVNSAWTAILGWAQDDLIGRSLLDFVDDDDRERTQATLDLVRRQEVKLPEIRMLHKDGSCRWISWVGAPESSLIYANGRDVTAEKEAEEAFQRSQSRFRAIFQTSYQYKCIANLDGTVLEANPASLRGIERRLDEVMGKPLWETPWFTATPGVFEKVQAGVEAAVNGHAVRQEIFLNLPIGPRWFDLTIRPILNARGEVLAILSEGADITARRQAEEALRQSQKLEAIGQLTGGIAHDFNNLLTPIVGCFDLLQRKYGADPQASRLISGAQQAAERARLLVQRLLAFARRQHLEARAVDLRELVKGMFDLIERSLGPRIEVRVAMQEGLPAARVDPNQLEVALLNLAVNARDAMPDGGVIVISARTSDVGDEAQGLAAGRYVCLSVADEGIGMPPETLAHAIEPFFTTKAIGKGTGLGLSMVHGLAAQSGGQLTLESAPSEGTIATLWLPACEGEGAGVESAALASEAASPSRPLSVLLVDDDDLVREGAAAMMEALGCSVVQSSSATRALEYLASDRTFDVLVTDQRMPSMTGVDLVRRARSIQPDIAAVLITGYADALEPDAIALPLLAKPFRAAEIARALAEAQARYAVLEPGA